MKRGLLKWDMVGFAIALLLRNIDPQQMKELVDDWLDRLEDKFADNARLLQAINLVREIASVPDDIGGDED